MLRGCHPLHRQQQVPDLAFGLVDVPSGEGREGAGGLRVVAQAARGDKREVVYFSHDLLRGLRQLLEPLPRAAVDDPYRPRRVAADDALRGVRQHTQGPRPDERAARRKLLPHVGVQHIEFGLVENLLRGVEHLRVHPLVVRGDTAEQGGDVGGEAGPILHLHAKRVFRGETDEQLGHASPQCRKYRQVVCAPAVAHRHVGDAGKVHAAPHREFWATVQVPHRPAVARDLRRRDGLGADARRLHHCKRPLWAELRPSRLVAIAFERIQVVRRF
mmetsp:Transcript_69140/g.200208  ORF Transcript_69140/g.200208 Transcript_69140/m.200208 type:complete len:273 (-) Transcript_69140:876-1694(-)